MLILTDGDDRGSALNVEVDTTHSGLGPVPWPPDCSSSVSPKDCRRCPVEMLDLLWFVMPFLAYGIPWIADDVLLGEEQNALTQAWEGQGPFAEGPMSPPASGIL